MESKVESSRNVRHGGNNNGEQQRRNEMIKHSSSKSTNASHVLGGGEEGLWDIEARKNGRRRNHSSDYTPPNGGKSRGGHKKDRPEYSPGSNDDSDDDSWASDDNNNQQSNNGNRRNSSLSVEFGDASLRRGEESKYDYEDFENEFRNNGLVISPSQSRKNASSDMKSKYHRNEEHGLQQGNIQNDERPREENAASSSSSSSASSIINLRKELWQRTAKQHNISSLFIAPMHSQDDKLTKCCIIREKGKLGLGTRYTLYFQDGKDTMVMLAEKQPKCRTANYHIYDMSRGGAGLKLSKKSGNFVGKLRGNAKNSEYSLFTSSEKKEQIGGFIFNKVNVLQQIKEGQMPRRLKCLLPCIDDEGVGSPYLLTSDRNMIDRCKSGMVGSMLTLETKAPTFERGQYRLNFGGRVTTPSVKNFQVTSLENRDEVIAQFGRVEEDRFHLDFRRPLNALQAFGMALAQFNL